MENEISEKMMVNFLKKLMDTMEVMQRKVVPESAMTEAVRPRLAPCPVGADGLVTPQVFFRPRKLFISERCAKLINVDDIRVGYNSQTVASGSIPGEMFMAPSEMISLLMSESEKVGFLKAVSEKDRKKIVNALDSLSNLVDLFEALGPIPAAMDVCQPGCLLRVSYSMKSKQDMRIPFEGVFVGEAIFG